MNKKTNDDTIPEKSDLVTNNPNYINIKEKWRNSPFYIFCQANIPFISQDFDGLNYYNLLCQLVDFLNKVIHDSELVVDHINDLTELYNQLNEWVKNYFTNLDVQKEINNKLDSMASSGELTNLIKSYVDPYINEQNDKIEQINNKVETSYNSTPIPVNSISLMTEHSKVYLLTTSGEWYYYNGSSFVVGGTYQSNVIGDNKVQYNNLDLLLKNIYNPNNLSIPEVLTIHENNYYNTEGVLTENSRYNAYEYNVVPGEIYYLNYSSTISPVITYFFAQDNTIISNSGIKDTNNIDILCVPEKANKLLINQNNNRVKPQLLKVANLNISNDIIKNIISPINAIYNKGFTDKNGIHYFNYITFSIPATDLLVKPTDSLMITGKLLSNDLTNYQGTAIFYNTTSTETYSAYSSATNKYNNNNNFCDFEVSFYPSNLALNNLSLLISPDFTESMNNTEVYMYDLRLYNTTTGKYVDLNSNYLTSNNQYIEVSPLLYLMNNQISKYLEGFIPLLNNKDIYCAGDSLTVGFNNVATNSYVDYLKEFYNTSNVVNMGHNGWGADGLVNILTSIKRVDRFDVYNPSYDNCSCVIINIGTNGGVTGNPETSIPQISNATSLNDEPLTSLNVTDVIDNGIKYNGQIINNYNSYFNLFSNDYYGNVALCIEWIQWKNPKTQIILLPPCISSIPDENSNSSVSIYNAMKKLSDIYGIEVIDINRSIGINRRNENLYRGDYVHGTNLRNEMVGKFVSRYISNKIYN